MKRLKRCGILLLALLCAFPLLSSCNKESEDEETVYYTVLFDSNGGSPVEKQTVAADSTVREPTPPTREGYVFEGWRSETGTFWNFAAQYVTSDMTLTAVWVDPARIFEHKPMPEGGTKITAVKQTYATLALPDTIAGYSVTAIGDGVFAELSSHEVQSITLPHTLTSVGTEAFYNCRDIAITFDPRAALTEVGESAFYGCNLLSSVRFGEGLTEISPWAFDGCTSLREIRLPKSVTSVSDSAFANCTSLVSVMFYPELVEIGNAAFDDCDALTTLYFYGNEAQIDALKSTVASQNGKLLDATPYYYSATPPSVSGPYWFLNENGAPQLW